MFSAFSQTTHVGSGSKHHILAVQSNQLGNPQTRLNADEKKRPVTAANPIRKVRDSQQGIDLIAVEKLFNRAARQVAKRVLNKALRLSRIQCASNRIRQRSA